MNSDTYGGDDVPASGTPASFIDYRVKYYKDNRTVLKYKLLNAS